MVIGRISKLVMIILTITVIFLRDFYYLLVIGILLYISYHFKLYQKIYKVLNKLTGNTKKVTQDRNKKNKYLKKLFKSDTGEM